MVEGNLPHHCKTFLAAISHCPFREQTPRCFALIAIAIGILPAAHPHTKFAGDPPRNRVPHHTFGLLSVPGAVLPFFYVYVAKSAESDSVWQGNLRFGQLLLFHIFFFVPGRKFKMFTYLTNIHYHATYSKLLCLNIRNL